MSDPALLDDPDDGPRPAQETAREEETTLAEQFVGPLTALLEASDVARVEELVEELHPADLADVIALLHQDERLKLIELLGGTLPAEVLAELDPNLTEEIISAMRPEAVADAVAELDTDDAAFILEDLDDDKRAEILAKAPVTDRLALNQAFDFEEESAGRLMQREVFAAPSYWTVGQIIDRLRGSDDLPDRFYEVFVVDPAFKPIGAVPLSTLLKTQRDIVIADIMNEDLTVIPVAMDQEDVAYKFEQYNLISAPVVDEAERLVGMITVDDVVEIVNAESREDMLALGGVESDAGLTDSVVETVRSRFSWLAVNLATAVLASLVISVFEQAIEQVVALAVLMPIVASMGGNAGTQTLTVAVRSLATKDLTASNAARIVWRETIVGGLNGILFAIILGVLAGVWHANTGASVDQAMRLAIVIGTAMIVNLLAAGLAGILVPLGLQRVGADPAISSAVFVTTVTDIVGFFVFLGLAALVLL
ncbi:MAG: magnesium transporter [Parvularculaceae bacterium]|nr:magnesium transporter [Parvularculaceae bacterium]